MTNSLNLKEIDQEQTFNLCKFFIRAGKPLFLIGRRGVGKTSIAVQAIKECGYNVNYINLSVLEAPSLAGYPNIFADTETITFKSPNYLPPLPANTEPNNVILFDELDKAAPELFAPLLEILQFRTINNKPINAASCILTGNLLAEGSYSNDISSALLDRCAKYQLQFDFLKWQDWAKINGVHDLILGFLTHQPELACGIIENTQYASPSPRGWTYASEAIIKAKSSKIVDVETITSLIAGFVGFEAAMKFSIWYKYYREFEPYILAMLEKGECKKSYSDLSPTEQLVFCITACNIAKNRILSEKSKPKVFYLENLCKFILDNNVSHENQLISLTNSFPFELITKYKLYTCKPFFDLVSKLQDGITIKK